MRYLIDTNIAIHLRDRTPEIVDRINALPLGPVMSRRRILDRMIAAAAIAHSLTLITLNPADFRDIPDAELDAW